jgi:hypothetical protein
VFHSDPPEDLYIKSLTASNAEKYAGKSLLFFLRRIPKLYKPREWMPPKDPAKYIRALDEEGFIVPSLLKGPLPHALKIDLRELDQHLMPHFWRATYEAEHYQNKYYQYHWGFIVAAFLTTVFAASNVFLHTQNWQDVAIFGVLRWTVLLSWLMVLNSAVAAIVSFLQANETPHRRWFKARTEAESLRSLYFLYLARQNPFNIANTKERVEMLRVKVLEILMGTRRDPIEKRHPADLFPVDDENAGKAS